MGCRSCERQRRRIKVSALPAFRLDLVKPNAAFKARMVKQMNYIANDRASG
jgi:hypothetical protein